ncbi:MAG: ferrous iron transport protein B [Armatimonadota bacterium]|nr:MAG: ferrous iron transport protein B [Armatimonadota bacterium]
MSLDLLRRVSSALLPGRSCHAPTAKGVADGTAKVVLAGSPNVGKSVVFNRLTGAYATVSNYPGTTVEVSRGRGRIAGVDVEVVDTPGMYSLSPITAEEIVARSLLIHQRPDVVVQVSDAKNLRRMLPLTLELLEAGLPLVLDLNVMDEAEELGIAIDTERLERELGVPVVATVSTTGRGTGALRERIGERIARQNCETVGPPAQVEYGPDLDAAVAQIAALLTQDYGLSNRAVAVLLLQEDEDMLALVEAREPALLPQIEDIIARTRARHRDPLRYAITLARQRSADRIIARTATRPTRAPSGWRNTLSRLMMTPLTGVPILLVVLYLGLYKFVGQFGAGVAVDFLEGRVFDGYVIPVVTRFIERIIPWPVWSSLFVGNYGIITLGIKYAVAIILPIVATFFLVFAVIEDTGYLPRLAMLLDRVFKAIGLSGRAVIPMVLGFGCDTMATMVTRVLETTRERIIATLLLALAIPCSAQLGVILALLAHRPLGLAIWAGVVGLVFLLVGFLSARLVPGRAPSFYMEIPPLRLPSLPNILSKTYARMEWYLMEVLPLFILASVVIWVGQLTGIFQSAVSGLEPVVRFIGLPPQAAVAFLFGFFRRDYGAAGLYDLDSSGALDGVQLVVAMVTMTLFLPCIAQFLMMWKERGWKIALAIAVLIFPLAFGVGYMLNAALTGLGVKI